MYAVIETGGKQYRVQEGDVISVEKLGLIEGEGYTFDKVLMVSAEDGIKVGNPYVEGVTVAATTIEEGRGKKVVIYKYKSKKGYHKKTGHRQSYTKLKINTINA
jgi:large subunit ribosomal protein L21